MSTNKRLQDRVALVTGGASGIGRAIALRFAEEGARVTVADVRAEPREGGKPTHKKLEEMNCPSLFVNVDVSKPDQIKDAIDQTVSKFGSLDVMVNNAGVFPGMRKIDDISEEDYDRLMGINLKGVFFGSRYAADVMREQDSGGSIINMSSIAGIVGFNQTSSYSASKGGVTNLTRELALELGPEGIRVNAINPGVIDTAMTRQDEEIVGTITESIPLRRDGTPEDIANATLFLAGDESSYMTGHNLVVDGGFTAG